MKNAKMKPIIAALRTAKAEALRAVEFRVEQSRDSWSSVVRLLSPEALKGDGGRRAQGRLREAAYVLRIIADVRARAVMPSPASGVGTREMCAVCADCPATCKLDGVQPLYLCEPCSRGDEDHGCGPPSAPASAPGGTAGEARTTLCHELYDGENEGTFVLCEEPATHYSKCCGPKCAKHTCRHGRPAGSGT